MVLSPHYLNVLDHLTTLSLDDPRVGYTAAYGTYTATIERQNANSHGYIALGQHWAFSLSRRQWLMNSPYVDEYLDLIRNCDYRDRNDDRIFELFSSWGFGNPASSQDAAKGLACCLNRTVKLNTFVCYAKYIGAEGTHGTAEFFDAMGFANAAFFPEPLTDFERLPEHRYDGILGEQMRWARVKL